MSSLKSAHPSQSGEPKEDSIKKILRDYQNSTYKLITYHSPAKPRGYKPLDKDLEELDKITATRIILLLKGDE